MSAARASWLALLALAVLAHAGEPAGWSLQVADADPVVRHGLLWRCRIAGEVAPERFDQGPYLAQVSLTQGGQVIATQEFPLVRLGQLAGGIDVVLLPGSAHGEEPVELAVTVGDAARRDLQHLTRALPTPLGLQRGLERRQRLLAARGERDPLPALWLEQAGELMLAGPTIATCQQLVEIGARLDRWLAGAREPGALRARRDDCDGSIQPYRLHLPAQPPTVLVAVLADAGAVRKCDWPTLPEAWLQAARDAGCALLEVYPAGDAGWDGIARPRTWAAIAAARLDDPRLAGLPLALVGHGRGAAGAVGLAEEQPLLVRALGLIEGRLPAAGALPVEPHERWRALQRAGERPAHLLATTIALAGSQDASVLAWSRRLVLAGHPQVGEAGAAAQADFWRALAAPGPAAVRREWVVLAPGRFGSVLVEELADWGISAALTQDEAGDLRTVGIARLRPMDGGAARVDGRAWRAAARAPAGARKSAGQATGPLAGYATAPFTVVVGTGESAAAQADNRALAQAFAAAWAAHAHGRPRLVDDLAVADDAALTGQHLVLIGNTRSNQVLARLAARTALPLQWDARTLTVAGGSAPYLRAERRAVALAWPHPALDGRLLVVLDGRPAWRAQGLPLGGLPDLVIGGLRAEDPPALERTFGNDWR